jgi:hypothetical protein
MIAGIASVSVWRKFMKNPVPQATPPLFKVVSILTEQCASCSIIPSATFFSQIYKIHKGHMHVRNAL